MHTKTSFRFKLSVSVASLVLCAMVGTAPAHAGFQWVPPEQAAAVPAAPMMSQPRVTTTRPQVFPDMPPQIIEAPSAPASAALAPALTEDAMKAQVMPFVFSGAEPSQDKVVLGFANNVPLSVALRQVLPSDIGFSVGEDVSLGTLVSWRGGSAWHQVMREMLVPAGLIAVENGNLVKITQAKAGEQPSRGFVPQMADATLPAPMPMASAPVQPSLVPDGIAGMPLPQDMGAPSMPSSPLVDGEMAAPVMQPPMGSITTPVAMTDVNPALGAPEALHAPMPLTPASATQKTYPSVGYLVPPAGAVMQQAPSLAQPQALASVPQSIVAYPVPSSDYDVWTAERGQTLRQVIQKWCERSNVDLSWQSEYDYPLQASVALSGGFEEAIRGLLAGFQEAKPQPIGRLHKNEGAAQTVLVVSTRGNKYND